MGAQKAPDGQIEITPAMVAAGVEAVEGYGIADLPPSLCRSLVERVFFAMRARELNHELACAH